MSMYIVMTSRAKMPTTCWGTYRRVAVVQLNQHYTAHGLRPAMVSQRARGVLRVIDLGHHHVGKTSRGAYQRALVIAEKMAYDLNNNREIASGELLITSACA